MNVNRAPKEVPLRDNLSEIVLIVDDIPENLSLLHDALDETGYTVLVPPTANPLCSGRALVCRTLSCSTP